MESIFIIVLMLAAITSGDLREIHRIYAGNVQKESPSAYWESQNPQQQKEWLNTINLWRKIVGGSPGQQK